MTLAAPLGPRSPALLAAYPVTPLTATLFSQPPSVDQALARWDSNLLAPHQWGDLSDRHLVSLYSTPTPRSVAGKLKGTGLWRSLSLPRAVSGRLAFTLLALFC